MITIEICVNGITSALAAQTGGAHRVELCDNLAEGGTTPSFGTIAIASDQLHIETMVMIRPRGGDFCYNTAEFEVMKANIKQLHSLSVTGIVLGILKPTGQIDLERCRALIELAKPMKVTFHRAFDMVRDPLEALDDCLAPGVDTILTSGLKPKASQRLDLIRDLQKRAGNALALMPGSGVTIDNAREIVEKTAVSAIHVSSAVQHQIASQMSYQNRDLSMGSDSTASEYTLTTTSVDRVHQLVTAVNG